ncbi:MAG TPA: iron ABC transporter permease [Actinomycetota bacterium]|nr:iron ABC transporter permease [Actinomycetota bacterium]
MLTAGTTRGRRIAVIAVALGFVVLAVLIGVLVGPADLSASGILHALFGWVPGVGDGSLTSQESTILWQLRAPRVVLACIVGACLSISGASYQGAFRNPLADPYLLGAAAGAGLGATLVIIYGAATFTDGTPILPIASFVGALAGVALAYAIGGSMGGRTTVALVLAGVAVASFLTAIQTFIQQRNVDSLREVYTWILGRLTTAGWSDVVLILPYAVIAIVLLVLHGRMLDVLGVGDDEAASLGMKPARTRLIIVAAASLATAAAVAVAGLIGFVGIIVPHAVRLVVGTSNRWVVPLSAIGGAAFLVLADVVARTAVSPGELPIGVVTALVGAPAFALLLRRSGRVT